MINYEKWKEMTESNFIALHTQTGNNPLNIAGRLHLNVNPVSSNTSTGIIVSAIVHVDAHSINNNTVNTSIESVLEQVETIEFTYVGSNYILNINSTTLYNATHPFYYFTIDPIYIDNIFDANIVGLDNPALITDVTFTPYLADLDFGFSDSNPLFSNALTIRKSKYLMQSDRLESTVLPSNSASLYEETADKAFIQDSMYFDTGWSRARYIGSKTSTSDNAGIEPALAGRSFKGEQFSTDTTTDYICQLENRLQQEFFHDGETQLPIYTLSAGDNPEVPTAIGTLTQPLDGGNTLSDTDSTASGATNLVHTAIATPLKTGDIITLNPFTIFPPAEFMRVVSTVSPLLTTVERDIYRTRTPFPIGNVYYPDYQPSTGIFKLVKYNIYSLDKSGQSRLNSVGASRIYVEGSNSIVESNKAGVLTSQSFCPVFINYVDSPSG